MIEVSELEKMSEVDLSALVAEKLMGWKWQDEPDCEPCLVGPLVNWMGVKKQLVYYPPPKGRCDLPHYADDVSDAIKVLHDIASKNGARWFIESCCHEDGVMYWVMLDPNDPEVDNTFDFTYRHQTLARAICIVALLAKDRGAI